MSSNPRGWPSFSERRNGPGLIYLASHVGAIAANSVVLTWTWGSWWCVPFFLLQGILLNFLYAPEHECDHHTAFKTRWLNVWVARVCGFIIFNPSEDHRWGHYSHHRNTQDWEKDIELGDGPFENVRDYLWMMSGFPLIWWKGGQIARHALGRANEWYLTPAQGRAVVQVSRWMVAGYVLAVVSGIVFQSWWWLYYWIGPFMLMRWTYMLEGGGEHRGLTHQTNTLFNTRHLGYQLVHALDELEHDLSCRAPHFSQRAVPPASRAATRDRAFTGIRAAENSLLPAALVAPESLVGGQDRARHQR